MKTRALVAATLGLLAAGCSGIQTTFGGDSAESSHYLTLFWIFMAVCAVIYVLVMAALLIAIWRRRQADDSLAVDNRRHHENAAILRPALMVWAATTAAILILLAVASFFTDRSNAASAAAPKLFLTVTANQWWWDVEYRTADTSKMIRTANEIHLPVGVPAAITLKSNDVIHSLWIPNLAGKQDLIPGRVTDLDILPRRIGLYRGQCAEFCGVQHAHMAINVTVESKADFNRWVANQQRTAFAPVTPLQMAGYRYFTTRECSSCHNVGGTTANGTVGPDLTHFASRRSIAAGTLPMGTGNIYGWIADPQSLKPGNHMPTIGLEPQQLHAVVAYLERLK